MVCNQQSSSTSRDGAAAHVRFPRGDLKPTGTCPLALSTPAAARTTRVGRVALPAGWRGPALDARRQLPHLPLGSGTGRGTRATRRCCRGPLTVSGTSPVRLSEGHSRQTGARFAPTSAAFADIHSRYPRLVGSRSTPVAPLQHDHRSSASLHRNCRNIIL